MSIALPFVLKKCEPYQIVEGKQIQRVMGRRGYVLSLEEAILLWQAYSNDRDCSWLVVPPDDVEIWRRLEDELPDQCIMIG